MNDARDPAHPPRAVRVVLPGGVDDPARPSGGNTYDRRVCRDLPGAGWQVAEYAVAGGWPAPDAGARAELARVLGAFPDGAVVLLDGIVACAVPEVIVAEADRLRLAVLVHLPLGDETGLAPERAAELNAGERRVLRAVSAVVATSRWAARRLVRHHELAPERVHVAVPGADPASPATGSGASAGASGGEPAPRLLCVASVTRRKGQHLLVEALADVAGLPWSCVCVGGLGHDPGYVADVRESIAHHGLADRIILAGARGGEALDASYRDADLLVLPSYAETYGMAVTEALARAIPVLATAVGGVPEAVGHAPGGGLPGILVAPGDRDALSGALRDWLREPGVRARTREAALGRRTALARWDTTSRSLAEALERLRHEPRDGVDGRAGRDSGHGRDAVREPRDVREPRETV
ncbi:glycosyltransferase family 4 protein [Streptomyces corynorhini]|uniref:D-inositol 3-phosphate glycosyltransferase n=1 Tax=Streptomyces corynorhini TaxID=2282652 RepID=A0A370B4U8_9ACTN|nr:glycosyltransferase family 4 protein [Streptomyces corynorhini]RDG35672.1 glycosyltransferase [Streptomyces corynorhini]